MFTNVWRAAQIPSKMGGLIKELGSAGRLDAAKETAAPARLGGMTVATAADRADGWSSLEVGAGAGRRARFPPACLDRQPPGPAMRVRGAES